MIRQILSLGVVAFFFAVGSPARASSVSEGTISKITVMNTVVFFNLDGPRTSTPPCHTINGRWAFDVSTPAGQAKLAFLLSAYNTQRKIGIVGSDNCNVWNDTESVGYFWIVD